MICAHNTQTHIQTGRTEYSHCAQTCLIRSEHWNILCDGPAGEGSIEVSIMCVCARFVHPVHPLMRSMAPGPYGTRSCQWECVCVCVSQSAWPFIARERASPQEWRRIFLLFSAARYNCKVKMVLINSHGLLVPGTWAPFSPDTPHKHGLVIIIALMSNLCRSLVQLRPQ